MHGGQGAVEEPRATSYGQILKSSALIGGASAVNIGLGIMRLKVTAVLLGPAGVGLMALYGSIADMAQTIAGIGTSSSGVRQIAEAVGSGDTERIGRSVIVLRRLSIVLGVAGGGLLVLLSRPLSFLTFGTDQHAGAVALLSLAVFFRCVAGGQGALIQGMRRVSDLARIGILGAVVGTFTTIVLIYFLRERGVVPSLVAGAAITLAASWWYSRNVQVQTVSMTPSQVRQEAAGLLRLGLAFVASSFMGIGTAYLIRLMVLRHDGYGAAGLYQAAWTLGGLYIGFVLQAMGTDFLPRVTGVADDPAECNRLVNEQTLVSLLVAAPGVLATLVLAPLILQVFYSAGFQEAVGTLRWISLGMILRAVTWPMSFVLIAKGRKTLFVTADLAWTVFHVGTAYPAIQYFGLNGAAMAFFASYIFYGVWVYPIVRRISGFRWSAQIKRVGFLSLLSITVVFGAFHVATPAVATTAGSVILCLFGYYCLGILAELIPAEKFPVPIQWLFKRLWFEAAQWNVTDACRSVRGGGGRV